MKICYVDESGTGDEPYSVMVGIITDAYRMYKTKEEWSKALATLEKFAKKPIKEFHAKDFYKGKGSWYGIDGSTRAEVISIILRWLKRRNHKIVYTAVDKEHFNNNYHLEGCYHKDVGTLWCFMALHICLSVQKCHSKESGHKGHTVFIFDNKDCEKDKFTELIKNPPDWTNSYYKINDRQNDFDRLIDVPFFADSKHVISIQLADLLSYLLRRSIELKMGASIEEYKGEKQKIKEWTDSILELSIPKSMIYLSKGRRRRPCSDLFYRYAPSCIL